MIRWRCFSRKCRPPSKTGRRRSTEKKLPVPVCLCGQLMTIDHYRTTHTDTRKQNCWCSAHAFTPHRAAWCKAEQRRQFEAS